MKERIFKKIQENFSPKILEVENKSDLHKGHAESNNSGQTHFEISISSELFVGISRVAIHREINHLLKDEFKNGLHSLEIKIINLNS